MRLEQLELLGDRCLLMLAPNPALTSESGLHLAHGLTPVVAYGRVLRTGPSCRDVAKGDVVAFPPSAGDPFDYQDYALLFVHEREIAFVLDRRGES